LEHEVASGCGYSTLEKFWYSKNGVFFL